MIVSVVLLALSASAAARATGSAIPAPEEVVQAARRHAQEAGAYHFATEIVQATYPAPALVNVGRSSRQT